MTPTRSATDVERVRPHLPTNRDEDWRYAPVRAITAAVDAALAEAGRPSHPNGDALAALLDDLPDGDRVVLVDGRYDPTLSSVAAGGPTVEADVEPQEVAPPPFDGFERWNRETTEHVVRVLVVDDGGSDHLLNLVQLTTGAIGPSQPRVEIHVEATGRIDIVETFRSLPGVTFTNATTSLHTAPSGRVDHLVVLEGPVSSAHVVRTSVVAADHAHVTVGVAALGDGDGHHRLSVALDGPGAEVTLTGLTVSSRGTHHDTLASVRHLASHGTSRQLFASIVADGARASFTGQVVVAHGTVGTDADQQNRNLLLGPTARADTRPWLEIHSDEVACTHGATVGRLDDDAVVYLRSRGIAHREARTMLMRAFASTLVERLAPSDAVRDWVDRAVTAALDEIVGDDTTDGEERR